MAKKDIHKIDFNIPVQVVKDETGFVVYTPALDLCTQGDTHEEAKKMFEEAFTIFIEELIEKGTLEEVLQSCGWTRATKTRKWIPPERTLISDTQEKFTIPCPA